MATTFRQIYDNPPRGAFRIENDTSTSAAPSNTPFPDNAIPNEVVRFPSLPRRLVTWAEDYLNDIEQGPDAQFQIFTDYITKKLRCSAARPECMIIELFFPVKCWTDTFIQEADQLPNNTIQHVTCERIDGIPMVRKLVRGDQARLVIEYTSTNVFDNYCHSIRKLASQRGSLHFDESGRATGAQSILIKVSWTGAHFYRKL